MIRSLAVDLANDRLFVLQVEKRNSVQSRARLLRVFLVRARSVL